MEIKEVLNGCPDFMRPKDLVSLGIFRDVHAVYLARKNKTGPDYIKLNYNIVYPKAGVIEFLNKRLVTQDNSK